MGDAAGAIEKPKKATADGEDEKPPFNDEIPFN
jgi:hypothetical protein